jgi:serine/threonine protein kinase
LQRLKASTAILETRGVVWVPDEIVSGDSSIVKFTIDSNSNLIAVKTAKNAESAENIRREAAILETVKHPLVIELRSYQKPFAVVTAYAGYGSLAGHHPPESQLHRPNRIAKVVAGIALAMRFLHSCGITHRDLKPQNILLDWDWTVRIADFGHSTAPVSAKSISLARPDADPSRPSVDSRYLAPECYDCVFRQASDVFAFGLILFEILAARPAFPPGLDHWKIACRVAINGERPAIPDFVHPPVRALIEDCLEFEPDDRPTFGEIADRLAEMEFKVTAGVNSAKVARFVRGIEKWEEKHSDD